ncbi:hypothetical protein BKI52_02695 [marine bacterium AO1-C]|nr:hypothetical protein BKI52_02695 [marine bacterium AO1-C]
MATVELIPIKTKEEQELDKLKSEYMTYLQSKPTTPISPKLPIPKTVNIQGYHVNTFLLGIALFFILLIII